MKYKVERDYVLYVDANDAAEAAEIAKTVPVDQWWHEEERTGTTMYDEGDSLRGDMIRRHAQLVEDNK